MTDQLRPLRGRPTTVRATRCDKCQAVRHPPTYHWSYPDGSIVCGPCRENGHPPPTEEAARGSQDQDQDQAAGVELDGQVDLLDLLDD